MSWTRYDAARMTQVPDEIPAPLLARPIDLSHAVARAITESKRFPESELTRPEAVRDVAMLLVLTLGYMTALLSTGLPMMLVEWLPEVGPLLPAFINGVISMGAVALLLRHRRQTIGTIGLSRWRWQWLGVGILAVPACYAGGAVSNVLYTLATSRSFVEFVREREGFLTGISDIPLWLIGVLSIFVGMYEEILFRGFLLTRLRALSRGVVMPVVLSSAIFGSLHFSQGVIGMCQTAVVGLVLAMVAVRTRSLWPCMIAHALIDSISLVMAGLLSEDIQKFLHEVASQPAG